MEGSRGAGGEIRGGAKPADVAVVGLGAVGSATLAALAARGVRAVGFDRHMPPHPSGSSHGGRRMIREAYFEAPFYVPLIRAAYDGWAELERRSGRTLLRITGGLMVGPPDGELVRGALASARAHGLAHELLDPAEIRRRFPPFRPPDGSAGVLERRAGMLDPEACVRAFLKLAAAGGAELRTGEPVLGWEASAGGVTVRSASGRLRARRLLLAAGAWTPGLVSELGLPLVVERMVQFWFRPADAGKAEDAPTGSLDTLPAWAWEHTPGKLCYGFPAGRRGIKVGLHQDGEPADPDGVRREVAEAEVAGMRETLRPFLPAAAGPLAEASVCLYTNAPDRHFVLGPHPEEPAVVVASACSGHGFKFAPVLGEALADLLLDREPAFDLSPFRLERFGREA